MSAQDKGETTRFATSTKNRRIADLTPISSYSYDALNRLESATETQNLSQTWAQEFTFDRYGNRNFDAPNTTTLGSCSTAVCNPTINASDNRIAGGQGYSYDLAGNTTADAEGRQFAYDAENKQVLVKDAYSATIGTYFYDGDGKRVKKTSTTGDDVIFIYDAAGKLVEERNASTGALQTSYVYAGSRLLSTETSSGTSYLTNDHLGSPRINTDGNGTITARHDYHPFGEEILRSGYGSDVIRKQFTGYERDGETGLDFAQARSYHGSLARFTSPDDYLNIVRPTSQTNFNLYSYVDNNPLRYVDPDGQLKKKADGTIDFQESVDKNGKPIVVSAVIAEAVLKDGTRVKVVANYIQGTVTTDSGTVVNAQKFQGKEDSVKLVYTTSGGVVDKTVTVSPSQLLKENKIDPTSNCYGKAFAQGEVWINNEKGSIAAIIAGDNYTRATSPSTGDIGLYFKGKESDGTKFKDVVHAVSVSTVNNNGVVGVNSKNLGFLPQDNVRPGPGKGTAWEDTNTKLHIFTQKKN